MQVYYADFMQQFLQFNITVSLITLDWPAFVYYSLFIISEFQSLLYNMACMGKLNTQQKYNLLNSCISMKIQPFNSNRMVLVIFYSWWKLDTALNSEPSILKAISEFTILKTVIKKLLKSYCYIEAPDIFCSLVGQFLFSWSLFILILLFVCFWPVHRFLFGFWLVFFFL